MIDPWSNMLHPSPASLIYPSLRIHRQMLQHGGIGADGSEAPLHVGPLAAEPPVGHRGIQRRGEELEVAVAANHRVQAQVETAAAIAQRIIKDASVVEIDIRG